MNQLSDLQEITKQNFPGKQELLLFVENGTFEFVTEEQDPIQNYIDRYTRN
jgi:hypothetical protein